MAVRANDGSWVIHFSVFQADLRAGELRRNGSKVKLQEQPFQILAMLLERPGEIVTREELRARLWSPDTFVDFDHSLNSAIRRLRYALGDSAENPGFVETLGRRGYRFVAPVNGGSAASGIGIAAAPTRSKSSTLRLRVAIFVPSAIAIAVLMWALWRHPSRRVEMVERQLTARGGIVFS